MIVGCNVGEQLDSTTGANIADTTKSFLAICILASSSRKQYHPIALAPGLFWLKAGDGFSVTNARAISRVQILAGLQQLRGPYSLCKTNSRVVLFAMSFMETVIVLPSEEIVKRMTSTTFPSRLSVSSIVCSSIRLTDTLVLLRSPLNGVSVPSSFAV